jgi:hypothetical protein
MFSILHIFYVRDKTKNPNYQWLSTKLAKMKWFQFSNLNFPFIFWNIQLSPAYGVYIYIPELVFHGRISWVAAKKASYWTKGF